MKVFACTATREASFLVVMPDDVNMDEFPWLFETYAATEFDAGQFSAEFKFVEVHNVGSLERHIPESWEGDSTVYGKFLNKDVTVDDLKKFMVMTANEQKQLDMFDDKP